MDFLHIDSSQAKTSDESVKSPTDSKSLKHFKKSMIVEYEKIEHVNMPEDSQSSLSSSSSSSSSSSTSSSSSSSHSTSPSNSSSTRTSTDSTKSPFGENAFTKNPNEAELTLSSLIGNNCHGWPNKDSTEQDIVKKRKLTELNDPKNSIESSQKDSTEKKIKKQHSLQAEPTEPKKNVTEEQSNKNKSNTTTEVSSKSTNKNSEIKKKTYCICKSSDSQSFMM